MSPVQARGLRASGLARAMEKATDGEKEGGTSLSSAEGLGVFIGCRKAQREDSALVNIEQSPVPGD